MAHKEVHYPDLLQGKSRCLLRGLCSLRVCSAAEWPLWGYTLLGGLILVSKQGEWTKALLPQLLVITWPGYVCSRLSAVWLGLCQAFLTVQLLPAQVCLLSLPFTGVDSWETFCTSNSLWTSASGNPTCDHEMENMRDSDKGTVLWTVVHCVLIQMHIPHLPPPPHSRHTHRVLSQGWKNWLGN